MSEWKTYKLGEIADINPRVPLKQGNEYSFVEMKDLNATLKYVSPSVKKELKGGSKFQNGDTLFARITPCLENGKICQVKDLENGVGFGSTEFMVFRGKENLSDTDFIYYLTRTEYLRNNAIQAMTGTSGRQRVEKSSLQELEIVAPNLKIQKSIASILSSLDNKIELNLQMNQTLGTLAQTLFNEWFVNFNFPNFNGKLVDSPLGKIPEGWNVLNIGEVNEVTDFVANGSFASLAANVKYKSEPDYAILIRLTDYHRDFNGGFVYVDENAFNFLKKSKLVGGEIVIANVGANAGEVFKVPELQRPMTLGPNAVMIKVNELSNYLYLFLLSPIGKHNLKGIIAGSAQPKFNKTDFRKIKIIVPNSSVLKSFNEIYKSIYDKILMNKADSRTLIEIRDNLLPQIMTGKIDVKI